MVALLPGPHSRGPHLIDDFPTGRGRIDRLVYAPDDWDVVATEVFTSYGRVKVGFLAADRRGRHGPAPAHRRRDRPAPRRLGSPQRWTSGPRSEALTAFSTS